ncbi:MAG: NADP(H)-dependent aldo-keto reductase [Azoarcus sp.]|jgi:aryl-alcohol dehydrogenase-like predicted oxidoreductase|nr:NADP(H)-dependent aldo-keto reductase [Azoarcus sp.]
MQYRKLGNTGIDVSLIALGTMTWGEQNSEAEAHSQLDFALERGINLIDTAEMYPVPPRAETQGRTEAYIGTWLKAHPGARGKIILATKAAGPARQAERPSHLRGGNARHDRANLEAALNDSLERLQTDYVDLYQLHWPDRTTNYFGELGYRHVENEDTVPIRETLGVLSDLVKSGKVRHIGLSNETPWGVHEFLRHAENAGLPRVVSIQNPYNLLNRSFEIGLAEFAIREKVGLLAYSPLAFGTLTGKYLDGRQPPGARVTRWERFGRYKGDIAETATAAYVGIARRYGISPAQLALAYVNRQPFLTSNIIGATNLAQLEENIGSLDVRLEQAALDEIEAAHAAHPNPSP